MKRVFAVVLAVFAFAPIVAWMVIGFADGPVGPIPGGALTTGEFTDAGKVDWTESFANQPVAEIELQLVNPVGSRTVGVFVDEGKLYVPCDLGFLWRRVPSALARRMLNLIWFFKHWHEDAVADGRVVARVGGRRYALQAVRVQDPELVARFNLQLTEAAGKYFGALLPIETDPADIWYFRLDPRAAGDPVL